MLLAIIATLAGGIYLIDRAEKNTTARKTAAGPQTERLGEGARVARAGRLQRPLRG